MGNGQSSWTSSFHCFAAKSESATLFDSKGNFLRRVTLPLRAAELMLEEEPGHVVSPAEEIKRTRRYGAMRAEDELSARKAYVLVPLSKLNRKLSEADMAVIVESALSNKSKAMKRSGGSRVSPALAEECSKEEEEGREGFGLNKGFEEIKVNDISVNVSDLGFMCRQRGYSRGWKPELDTIRETSKF